MFGRRTRPPADADPQEISADWCCAIPTISRYLPSIPTWRYKYRQGRDIPRYIAEQIITVRRRNFTKVSLVSPTPCRSFHYSNVQNFKVQSSNFTRVVRYPRYLDTYRRYRPYRLLGPILRLANFQPNEIALGISGTAVVSSIAIPETVSLSSLQFQVSHNTTADWRGQLAPKIRGRGLTRIIN